MKFQVKTALASFACLALATGAIVACSSEKSGGGGNNSGSTNYTVSGSLTSVNVSGISMKNGVATRAAKTITHVMAISATGERFLGAVDSAGSFSLGIQAGTPYTFVFIDDTETGENMIVGIFKPDAGATGLDTLIPVTENGSADLGDVTVDGSTQVASMTTTLSTFLSAMGADSTAATTIGAVDDLMLRMANPDKNVNGIVDFAESLPDIRLDIHVRSSTDCTTGCGTGVLPVDSFVGTYTTDVTGFALEPNGTSIYLVYLDSYDSSPASTWVSGGALAGGATYTASAMTGYPSPDIDTNSSYSGLGFGNYISWGPDYSLNTAGIELPGYDKFVKLSYSFNSKTIEFPFFRSRPKADLFQLIPDFKLNVVGGFIESLDYRWMKWTGSAWAPATAVEVQLLVQEDTAAFGLYTAKGSGVEESVRVSIPINSAAGNIPWTAANVEKTSGVSQAVTAMAVTDFCSGTSSYDDKIGLRIFAHGFGPAATGGPTACP